MLVDTIAFAARRNYRRVNANTLIGAAILFPGTRGTLPRAHNVTAKACSCFISEALQVLHALLVTVAQIYKTWVIFCMGEHDKLLAI